MTSRRTKISPKTGRGLGHVTPTIFGSMVGYPSDSLASCFVILMLNEYLYEGCSDIYDWLFVVNVVGELQRKGTLAASRGFLAAARLSC